MSSPPTIPSLEERDHDVRARVEAAEREGFAVLDELLLRAQHGTAHCSGHGHDRNLNFVTGLLLVRAFNSLWRARQDVAHGYPVQALSLARSAFEDWVAVLWLEADSTRLPFFLSTLVDGVPPPRNARGERARLPSIGQMLKVCGDAGKGGVIVYDLLSKFSHPRGVSLRWQFDFDREELTVRAGGYFDRRDARVALYFLIYVAATLMAPIERLQRRWLGVPNAQWLVAAARAAERGFQYTDGLLDEIQAESEAAGPPDDAEGTAAQ